MFGASAAIMSPVFGYLLAGLGYIPMIVVLAIAALVLGCAGAQFTDMPAVEEATPPSQDVSPEHPIFDEGRSLTAGRSVRTPSFWFLWTTWALQGAACVSMITLATAYGLSLGFKLESAVVILTAFNLANGVSRFVGGMLSDVVGRNKVMSVAFFAAAAAYFTLPHVSTLLLLAILAIIIGFAFGTLFAVSAPLIVDCFGILHFGSIFGLVATAYGFVSGPIGPSLTGYMLDLTNGNYMVVFCYLGTMSLISSFLIRFVVPLGSADPEQRGLTVGIRNRGKRSPQHHARLNKKIQPQGRLRIWEAVYATSFLTHGTPGPKRRFKPGFLF